ncbi:hypothetical protein FSARC_12641 [Fusarium sarcochroum]|uniref:Major facilitator superfamily (MFS) profile domain-containing protein n=1 Tax=Fusarium sarcochroum TaxID=1208366 RepID=A0A8H4T704_9HYPO|nr:hypothetical protein FSARC_12641 [Fusarium sarcochroum]
MPSHAPQIDDGDGNRDHDSSVITSAMAKDPLLTSPSGNRVEERNRLEDEKTRSDEEGSAYGWVIVAAVFFINAHTWGLVGSYSVFIAHYLHSGQFDNPDPLTLAFIAGLSFAMALFVAPLVTFLNHSIGTKTTVAVGIVIQAGGLVAASFSSQIWHLVLSQGLVFGAGVGFIVNTTVSIVPQWFLTKRSFAVAITTAGSGTGGLVYSLTINTMINNIGLAWAFRVLAIVSFTVNGIAMLFLKDRNKSLGSVHIGFNINLFKRIEFLLLVAWGFFSQFGFGITIFSMSDFSQSMGFTAKQGSLASAIFNLSQAVGRPMIGLASDHYGRINVAGISTLIASVSTLLIWILAGESLAGTIVYTLFGAFASNMWTTIAPVGSEVMGIQSLPSVLSVYWLILVIPTVFAEPIALSLKTNDSWPYLRVQLFTGFMYLAAFLPVWLLRAWKLHHSALDQPSSSSTTPNDSANDRTRGSQVAGKTTATRIKTLLQLLVSVTKV